MCLLIACFFSASCSGAADGYFSYNDGIHIIPKPLSVTCGKGVYRLSSASAVKAGSDEAAEVAAYFIRKINASTGLGIGLSPEGEIYACINPALKLGKEGYVVKVEEDSVAILASSDNGLFYGFQTFMQLLPAEIESKTLARDVKWEVPVVEIHDAPAFRHRGIMLDPCRHFIDVPQLKKYIDLLAMFKMNVLHLHLTDDQGWRIEIKKYPLLTKTGAKRIEGEGTEHSGFYTQEEIKEIVKYAGDRKITIIPEIDIPGHGMAAIASYPELSCKGVPGKVRNIWGIEKTVMCAGKEEVFTFLEDVFSEIIPLFPSEYVHIGGDECPKKSWESCSLCQERIRKEGLEAENGHSAEERLQSYFIKRMARYIEGYGKKIIGWDEILEGGLAENAIVMSWRGEEGGIQAAMSNHEVIMTSRKNGLYIDHYQGDPKIEPMAIQAEGISDLERIYKYNPIPDTLIVAGKQDRVLGLQANLWSEYIYDEAIRDYMLFPRMLAVAETGWSDNQKKDFTDFSSRLHNALVRLDAYDINYHIPLPEQKYGSCDYVAFTDSVRLAFHTSRPLRMVYTVDGTDPHMGSPVYGSPISFSESGTLKIATLLPSGKMSRIRNVRVEKQNLRPGLPDSGKYLKGLKVSVFGGMYLNADDFMKANPEPVDTFTAMSTGELVNYPQRKDARLKGGNFAVIAEGYVDFPSDGVYYLSSEFEEVWIDDTLVINNKGEVKRFSRKDTSVALARGKHKIKVLFLEHIIGGWPSDWTPGEVRYRKNTDESFLKITGNMLFH